MLVVTMTSWTKRIGNVKRVVESIMDNTVKPDRVYLNLSRTEFEGIKLPKDLVEYFENDERLVINWVDGENTKSMKKVFPILKYLDDDDLIINMDDDMNIPKDFIEVRVNEFKSNGGKNPISGSNNPRCHTNKCLYGHTYNVICCTSIFQKKMLNGWDKIVDSELMKTYNDDYIYTLLMLMNGYRIIPTSKISTHTGIGPRKISSYNDNDGMGRQRVYKRNGEVLAIFEKKYKKVFGKEYKNLFINKEI